MALSWSITPHRGKGCTQLGFNEREVPPSRNEGLAPSAVIGQRRNLQSKRAKRAGTNEFPARVFSVVAVVLDPVRYRDNRGVFWDVMSEFEKAALVANSILMVPVACSDARGKAGTDYEVFDDPSKTSKCWYQVPKLRALFPEF